MLTRKDNIVKGYNVYQPEVTLKTERLFFANNIRQRRIIPVPCQNSIRLQNDS